LVVAGLVLTGVSSPPREAAAQAGGAIPSQSVTGGASRRSVAPLPAEPAPPPALPGAQSSGAAPSTRVPLDMPPTEALFDGVNRGDIEAVRDSLSRGAELNAQNILGITATELAIDLGHNDIAFLLLSMRGADKPRGGRTQANAPTPTRQARPAPQPRVTATQVQQPVPARSWANDPGTPAPNAGFLGFDERHIAR
jgi:hypothetical protein